MSRFAFPDLRRAFCDGEHFGERTARVEEVGTLVLPTGRIVACDPCYLVNGPEPAYTRAVPPGCYPVLLSWLTQTDQTGGQDVACAALRFTEEPVERWELALQPGWDDSTLKPGEVFGYGVDGGTGCFADELAVARLAPDQQRFKDADMGSTQGVWSMESYLAAMPPVLRRLCGPERRLRPILIDHETGANIVVFSSGIGDGCYASYFGLTVRGDPACLVTDFGLLVRSVEGRLELPVPVREHSEFAHPDLAYVGVDRILVDWNPASGEVTILASEAPNLLSLRFENRPGEGLGLSVQGRTYRYRLREPLQETARLIIEYTLRTEAM